MLLPIETKHHFSFPISGNGFSSFYHSYSNNGNRLHDQQNLTGSSYSITDPNYLQNQGSNLHTIVETEAEDYLKPPFIKRILLVDDDPDITLTFKAGLDGRYYGDGGKKKRFEVYTYNNPILVVKEFKPQFYDLLLTDIYMPHMNGYQLCEKILELVFYVSIRSKYSSFKEIIPEYKLWVLYRKASINKIFN